MNRLRAAFVAIGLGLGAEAFAFNEAFSVSPSAPVPGQEFSLTISGMAGCIPITVQSPRVNGNRIEVQAHFGADACFSPPTTYSVTQALQVNAAGEYAVTYQEDSGPVTTLGKVTVVPADSVASLEGIWFDPAAPGSGLSVTEGANGNLFLVWFTYRNERPGPYVSHRDEPSWYMVSGGTRVSPTEFRGTLHRTTGMRREDAYSAQNMQTFAVGEATLKVRGDGKLEFTTNSVTPPVSVVLQKFAF